MFRILMVVWLGAFLSSSQIIDPPRVEVVKFDELEKLMNRNSTRIEVINFWATWCKPCIKELPYFQAVHQDMGDEVKVTLISLDYAEDFETKVLPFIEKRQLSTDVLLLDEIDYNNWIDMVEPSWSGAIPATLIINHQTGKRAFAEQSLEKKDIEQMIKSVQ